MPPEFPENFLSIDEAAPAATSASEPRSALWRAARSGSSRPVAASSGRSLIFRAIREIRGFVNDESPFPPVALMVMGKLYHWKAAPVACHSVIELLQDPHSLPPNFADGPRASYAYEAGKPPWTMRCCSKKRRSSTVHVAGAGRHIPGLATGRASSRIGDLDHCVVGHVNSARVPSAFVTQISNQFNDRFQSRAGFVLLLRHCAEPR